MSEAERHLLLVAHGFPPAGGGGAQRPGKFAKFLPRHGWLPTVVTTQEDLYAERFGLSDPSQLDDLPPGVTLTRVRDEQDGRKTPRRLGIPGLDRLIWEIYRWRAGPDASYHWTKRAEPVVLEQTRRTSFSAVVATGPPFSALALGRRLARRLGLPFVADLRDPWCVVDGPSRTCGDKCSRRLERLVLLSAMRIVVVTDTMRRLYAAAYPELGDRICLIENGVDMEEPAWREQAKAPDEGFQIVYTGQFYTTSRPHVFLRGLALARERSSEFREQARFLRAGGAGGAPARSQDERDLTDNLGLSDIVVSTGYLRHAEALRLQRRAPVLLFLAQSPLVAACKSYEYLAAGRPVLALAPPDGEAAEILRRGVMTVMADRDDPEDVAEKLLALFARWERGELLDLGPPEVPEEYTRAFQARQLAALLDEVSEQHSGRARL